MILVCCEHCGHKISVQDSYAGKRGKCSSCGTFFVVPDKSTTIELHCESCGQRISVPTIYSGKRGYCPKCKGPIDVPTVERPVCKPKQEDFVDMTPRLAGNDAGLTLLEIPEEYRLKDESVGESNSAENVIEREREFQEESEAKETESSRQRKLPWFIDIFLYPTSPSGLISLIIFVIIPMLIAIVRILMGPLGFGIGLAGFFLNLAIGLYLFWFLTECVRDSAEGGTRAPEAFAISSLGDMWSQAQHIIGCYLILLGPVGFYHIFTQKTDVIFWLLLTYGAFFFPMGLLACVMFDSIRGLNPILLIGSIFNTFFHYIGLVLLIAAIILAFSALPSMQTDDTEPLQPPKISMLVVGGIFYGIAIYMAFVIAHLIGRFYWRNQEKLNWEV